MSLQGNTVSHWLGANQPCTYVILQTVLLVITLNYAKLLLFCCWHHEMFKIYWTLFDECLIKSVIKLCVSSTMGVILGMTLALCWHSTCIIVNNNKHHCCLLLHLFKSISVSHFSHGSATYNICYILDHVITGDVMFHVTFLVLNHLHSCIENSK